MKTAEERANDFLVSYVNEWTNRQERALIKMIKEQDRDTRHACAEVCLENADKPAIEIIGACHNSCMNVKAC